MKTRRIVSVVLAIMMAFSMISHSALTVDAREVGGNSFVNALEYQSVASEIVAAKQTTVIPHEAGNTYYYWNDNSFVVKDNSGYYRVEISEDLTQFVVNGRVFPITSFIVAEKEPTSNNKAMTYPTPWATAYNINNSFEVGGMAVSIVVGIVVSIVARNISAGLKSIVALNVANSMASTFLSGVLPVGYTLTTTIYVRTRTIAPIYPTVVEFDERVGVYGGPSNNPRKHTFCYNTANYTVEQW